MWAPTMCWRSPWIGSRSSGRSSPPTGILRFGLWRRGDWIFRPARLEGSRARPSDTAEPRRVDEIIEPCSPRISGLRCVRLATRLSRMMGRSMATFLPSPASGRMPRLWRLREKSWKACWRDRAVDLRRRHGTILPVNPYASQLGDRNARAVIAETPQQLAALAERLGPAGLERSPAPGKWPARAILCHLADCETVFAFRLRQALAEPHHIVQPFDQDKWAATYASIPATDAIVTFAALRRWNLLLIESALPANANKPVTHPERGTMTFATIV